MHRKPFFLALGVLGIFILTGYLSINQHNTVVQNNKAQPSPTLDTPHKITPFSELEAFFVPEKQVITVTDMVMGITYNYPKKYIGYTTVATKMHPFFTYSFLFSSPSSVTQTLMKHDLACFKEIYEADCFRNIESDVTISAYKTNNMVSNTGTPDTWECLPPIVRGIKSIYSCIVPSANGTYTQAYLASLSPTDSIPGDSRSVEMSIGFRTSSSLLNDALVTAFNSFDLI